ncbi:hypothetical protein [Brevibacterium sp. ZH18]|uniref:hypothetical protein n=1 Tax=Brevibacterium sp. ZH18 TaxID=2927784 RepID=UPI001F60C326|nr:hypothetical protein [Brevibacterium sp. ZH18]MCI4011675.1 hypothetical protein [Brevibacterium sp. ZH18]
MSKKPLLKLGELLNEAELTGGKYLIVEGATDKAFYREWVYQKFGKFDSTNITIESADFIEFDEFWNEVHDLTPGNRSYVMFGAKKAKSRSADIGFIADRDCGHHVDNFQFPNLWWTDFPALESYIFTEAALGVLNRLELGDRLPPGREIVAKLSPVLNELFTVRYFNRDLPRPDVDKGFGRSKNPNDFDIKMAVSPDVANEVDSYPRRDDEDPRAFAYGHDVASVLLASYRNEIKNQAKIPNQDVLESRFRACLLISKVFDASALAISLSGWLQAEL